MKVLLLFFLYLASWVIADTNSNEQCVPLKCPGVVLVGNYPYKVESIPYNKEGGIVKVDVELINRIIDTLYNDQPIPLLEVYKLIAEILKENPTIFEFLMKLDLKKYNLNRTISTVIWNFFAEPSKNLNKPDNKDTTPQDQKAQKLVSDLASKLISAFASDELTIYNFRDFLQEIMDNNPKFIVNIRVFLNNFLEQFKDSRDRVRKLIIKMVVALEVMKAESTTNDVKNQQDQLVALIKNFFKASPRLKSSVVDLIIDVQTTHELLPRKLYLKLGI